MKKLIIIVIVLFIGSVSVKTHFLSKDLSDLSIKIEKLQKDIDRTEGNTKRMNMAVYNQNAKEFNSMVRSFPNSIINSIFLGYELLEYK